jgi:hypothetical protein
MTSIPPKATMPEMQQVSIRAKKANAHMELTVCRIEFALLSGILLRKYRHEKLWPLAIP